MTGRRPLRYFVCSILLSVPLMTISLNATPVMRLPSPFIISLLQAPLMTTSCWSALTLTLLNLAQSTGFLSADLFTLIGGPGVDVSTVTMSAGSIGGSGVAFTIVGVGEGSNFSTLFFVMPLWTSHAAINERMRAVVMKMLSFM